ncbi:MerR family transcriptional regulator [Nocardia higoensis]|uniref:MerR family transcriptional regulator n=1 Tax=Nocardia higoensis TaxID=228599 RepID=UPI0002F64AE1|nr:MerR family transcriptional regulator [Nocardia higoensis]
MLIGEVSRRSGVSTRMLRHYDAVGLVQPTGRTSGGYREYSADDIRRLLHVESLRTLGLSLQEVKRALDEPEFTPAELVTDLIRHTRLRIAAEEELLAKLERVDAAAPAEWEDVLRVVALLRALESGHAPRRQQAVLSADAPTALPIDALVDAVLAEDNADVAGALRWSLARARGYGLEGLAAGLDSASVEVRRRAVTAIAELRVGEATELLRAALGDADATVRGRAALALGSRGEIDALPALLAMVVEGRSDVEAAETLGLLADIASEADIVACVSGALAGAEAPAVRLRLTQALAEIPGPAARRVLDALTHDGDREIAATATAILTHRDRGPRRERRNGLRGDPPMPGGDT